MATITENKETIIRSFQGLNTKVNQLDKKVTEEYVDKETLKPVALAAYELYPLWEPGVEYTTGTLLRVQLTNGKTLNAKCLKDFTSAAKTGNVPWSADSDAGNIEIYLPFGTERPPVWDKAKGYTWDAWEIENYVNNILVKLGNLEDLTTTEKATIVGAINELKTEMATKAEIANFATTEQLNAEKARITAIETAIGGLEKEIQDFRKTI